MSLMTEDMGLPIATASAVAKKESDVIVLIHQILALRKGMGTPFVSPAIKATILKVQDVLEKSTESWKKVDWRSGKKPAYGRGSSSGSSSVSSSSSPVRAAGGAGGPPPKYVSKFKSLEKVEDKILLLIQDKLNKFGPRNFDETYGFMCNILDAGRTDFLKEFMKYIFQKATREENMCPHYAKLVCELASKYKILLTEMVERYKEFSSIFEDISEAEFSVDDYTALLEANSDKAYRLGYAQFLGELTKYSVLDTELFVSTIASIVAKIPTIANAENAKRLLEDYVESLLRILQAVQHERSASATALRPVLKERFLEPLTPYTAKGCCELYKSLSQKTRFKILDITDIMKKF